jgi:predicted PurR-regulated permease PerM
MKKTHFLWAALIFFILLLYVAKPLTVTLLLSALIAYLLDPLVRKLESKRLKRKIIVPIIYGFTILLVVSVGVKLGSYISGQVQSFVKDLPFYIDQSKTLVEKMGENYSWLLDFLKDLDAHLATYLKSFLTGALRVASNGFYLFLVVIFSFSILINREKVVESVAQFIGREKVEKNRHLLTQIDGVLKGFFKGRILVCIAVFVLMSLGILFIEVKHSIFIAIFTGATAFIPYYGALAGIIPGVFASFASPNILKTVISIIVLIILVSSIESNIFTPLFTGRHVKLPPAIIIFSILCGGAIYGFWGIFFAMPVAGIIKVLYNHAKSIEDGSKPPEEVPGNHSPK